MQLLETVWDWAKIHNARIGSMFVLQLCKMRRPPGLQDILKCIFAKWVDKDVI